MGRTPDRPAWTPEPWGTYEIHPDCEQGWRRFLADTLVRTHRLIRELCDAYRRLGDGVIPDDRKDWEIIRRQVAAYRWVFDGSGGIFSLARVCVDLGLSEDRIRAQIVSDCAPPPDIKRVVSLVTRRPERTRADRYRTTALGEGLGSDLAPILRDFHSD